MGYAFLVCYCINCGARMCCNPVKVPSISVDGRKEPLCRACADKWNQIHRISKGLEPVAIQPDAYEACDENELP